jgi:nitrate/nitrite transport system permease protein
MSAIDDTMIADDMARAAKEARKERLFLRINRASGYLDVLGLAWLTPILRIIAGDSPRHQIKHVWRLLGVPVLGIVAFLGLWAWTAPMVQTSLGSIPGPAEVWEQTINLYDDHKAERRKEEAFYQRQDERNARFEAEGQTDKIKQRDYTGKPTYLDQIVTSLLTVAMGFLVATVCAVPLGIICGLSKSVNAGLNPLIQIFKPVSPLAWLPLVTMIVSAVAAGNDGWLPKSFIVSAITVTL